MVTTEKSKGMGVVGEQPIIQPGDEFEYTSGTPLKTSSGLIMEVIKCKILREECLKF